MDNLVSISFTDASKKRMIDAILVIKTELNDQGKSLRPDERQQYARVKYEKEIWIDKVKMYMDLNPDKIPSYIDKDEFYRDYEAHKLLNELLSMLEGEFEKMQDTNLLLGHDLDFNARSFYQSIKMAAKINDLGAKTIYDDLRQQFPGPGKGKKPPAE